MKQTTFDQLAMRQLKKFGRAYAQLEHPGKPWIAIARLRRASSSRMLAMEKEDRDWERGRAQFNEYILNGGSPA